MKKKVIICVSTVAVIALIICGIFYFRGQSSVNEGVFVTSISDLTNFSFASTRYSGVVESEKTVDYKQNADQTIEEIYVHEGDKVTVDQPLFKYNVVELQNKITSANIDIDEYAAKNQELQNYINAGGIDAVTVQQYQLDMRQNNYQIQKIRTEVAQYQVQVDNAIVKSTLNGTVKAVNDPSVETDSSKPIVSITQDGDFKITGKVDETNISMFTVGQPVIVRSRIDETQTWSGSITAIQTEPETNQNNSMYGFDSGETTSKYPFTVAITNSEGLMLGQHVYIEFDYGLNVHTEGIWLDMYFINYDVDESGNETPYVWKANGNRIVKQEVTLGDTDENGQIEILSGLTEEDEIAYPDETIEEGANVLRLEDLQ